MRERDLYYNKSQLKERGWTESIIKKLLANIEPKEFWGLYKSVPQKCYLISVIEKIEKTDEFKEYSNKAKIRSERCKKIADEKKIKNIEKLKQHLSSIKVKELDKKDLWHITFNDKMEWYDLNEQWDNITTDESSIDVSTKERWMVNYIRHNLTSYDDFIYEIYNKIGVTEMYLMLHEYVLNEIIKVYPYLTNECLRQIKYTRDNYDNFYKYN